LIKKFKRNVSARKLIGDKGPAARRPLRADEEISVASAQAVLREPGFLPMSGIDGICGYHTRPSIRLFQENECSLEYIASIPDGVL
jgi:peptidoglycan hydrolase-like protein with peptidoglycan-binding domain